MTVADVLNQLKTKYPTHNIILGMKDDGDANYIECNGRTEYILLEGMTVDELSHTVTKLIKDKNENI